MAHLVNDKCIMCKHTTCVDVCPVDCFYEGENMLVINPEECIDCGVCVPECPEVFVYLDLFSSTLVNRGSGSCALIMPFISGNTDQYTSIIFSYALFS